MSRHIEGVDKAMEILREFPINADKLVKKAMQLSSKKIAQGLKSAISNKSFRRLVRYKVIAGKNDGMTYAKIGLFGTVNKKSKKYEAWFHAYWKNYGTRGNRYPGHTFKEPLALGEKDKKNRRISKIGVRPRLFYDGYMMNRGIKEWDTTYKTEINRLAKEVNDAK